MEPDRQLGIERAPLPDGVDPHDRTEVRAWLVGFVEAEVTRSGRLAPAVRVFLPDAQLVVESGWTIEVGEHESAAATFRALAEWRDALVATREGEVVMTVDGTDRRVAALLELEPRPVEPEEQWRVTWRPIGTGDGGVGVLHGSWATLEGVGVEALPEPLREWLDAGDRSVRLGTVKFEKKPEEPVDLQMAQGTFPKPVPTAADALAEAIGGGADPEVLSRGLDALLIFTFRGADWQRWEVRGTLPCSLDDLIRAIGQWSKPESVAVVLTGVANVHGAQRRMVSTLAEVEGRRYERALPLTFGPEGRPSPMPVVGRWHAAEPLAQENRWVGTPPVAEVNLFLPAPGAETAEG